MVQFRSWCHDLCRNRLIGEAIIRQTSLLETIHINTVRYCDSGYYEICRKSNLVDRLLWIVRYTYTHRLHYEVSALRLLPRGRQDAQVFLALAHSENCKTEGGATGEVCHQIRFVWHTDADCIPDALAVASMGTSDHISSANRPDVDFSAHARMQPLRQLRLRQQFRFRKHQSRISRQIRRAAQLIRSATMYTICSQ